MPENENVIPDINKITFCLRGDTLERWQASNPVLAERELVVVMNSLETFEISKSKLKIGDGQHKFSEIEYIFDSDAAMDLYHSLAESQNEINATLLPLQEKMESIENGAEANVQPDWNTSDSSSDDYIKNKPTSMLANGGMASMLSNAIHIVDYNTFVPTHIASGAITPVEAESDANSPWENSNAGFLIQGSADSWHLLIFQSDIGGWAYRSYNNNIWGDWQIWSTFDGKYSSLSEKPSTYAPSPHTHNKFVIVSIPSSSWSASAPYVSTISVTGLKETDKVIVYPYTPKEIGVDETKLRLKLAGFITDGESLDGQMTFYCVEKKPTADFEVLLEGVMIDG